MNPMALRKRLLLPLDGKLSPASPRRRPPPAGKLSLGETTLVPHFSLLPHALGHPSALYLCLENHPRGISSHHGEKAPDIQKTWSFQLFHTNSRREAAWLTPVLRTWTPLFGHAGGGGGGFFHSIAQLCGCFLPPLDRYDHCRTNLTRSGVHCAKHIYPSKVKLGKRETRWQGLMSTGRYTAAQPREMDGAEGAQSSCA